MTIKEIAELAGVSSAAVSRYLNNGSLSAAKRERIRQVIEETNYRPSDYARALRTKKSKQIGVLVQQIDSESVPCMLQGIDKIMDENNYTILLMNTDLNQEKELRMLESFLTTQVDGLIYNASVVTEKHRNILRQMKVPVVILGQFSEEYSCVYHDDFGAAHDIMQYVLSKGKKHPVFLGVNQEDIAAGKNRYCGVAAALQEYGLQMEQIPYREVNFTIESGYEAIGHILQKEYQVDSVICSTDLIAVGVLKYLQEHNREVPKDICVTGIGHGIIADVLTPKLTTVHYQYEESGEKAAKMLLSLIDTGDESRTAEKQAGNNYGSLYSDLNSMKESGRVKQLMLDYYLVLQGTV